MMMIRNADSISKGMVLTMPANRYKVQDVERHAGFTLLTLATSDGTEHTVSVPSTLRFAVRLPKLFGNGKDGLK